ncbi:MAG: hypothetical protein QOH64_1892 [Acidimicrobiaceae bacterium]
MPSQPRQSAEGVVTKPCPRSVAEAIARLRQLIDEKALVLFAVIDHSGEASRAGLEMNDTKLVIFGSPMAGTPVMVAAPLAALDLPLRLLVWEDDDGAVWVSYNSPDYLAERHHLGEDLRGRLQPIDAISDAVVSQNDDI